MKPIYEPKARAKEYGDLAINIYTGCPHRCYYCFAPNVLHRTKEAFHSCVEPRNGIVEAVKHQLDAEKITDKLIHLCFVCDPYPINYDTTPTREIIKAIKESGNHVQILTKGGFLAERDFDLLDSKDNFGVTYAGYENGKLFESPKSEPNASAPNERLHSLKIAHNLGIKTWISCEPVLNAMDIENFLGLNVNYIDLYKIGKLNYHPSDISWKEFGRKCERILQSNGQKYYIKDDLRKEMQNE